MAAFSPLSTASEGSLRKALSVTSPFWRFLASSVTEAENITLLERKESGGQATSSQESHLLTSCPSARVARGQSEDARIHSEGARCAADRLGIFRNMMTLSASRRLWTGRQESTVCLQGFQGCRSLSAPLLSAVHKASFAKEALQPVPSPLQMLPTPVQPSEDAADSDAQAGPKTAQCVAKGLPMSPYKLNLVAKLVRGMSVQEALDQLEASPKRAAVPVYKAIHSARANAGHSHDMDTKRLIIEKCFVGHGQHLKRMNMHSKGRMGVKKRRRAHLTVVVREVEREKAQRVKEIEQKRYHPTQLRWVNRPRRSNKWVEELTARALAKQKQALNTTIGATLS